MQPPKAILETVIYATDLDAAERFYRDVVGLEVVKTFKNQFVFLRCGEQMLLIFNPETSRIAEGGNPLPRHGTTGAGMCVSGLKTRQRSMRGAITSSPRV